ncbi:MAG: ArsC/Spx/MgsR family protein [Pseudomonadota bacterium]
MTLYGIPTCDTCRKAQKALAVAGHAVTFRDVRAEPLTAEDVALFLGAFGEALVNRRSTTFRNLSEAEKGGTPDALLAAHPTVMKRPVLRAGDRLTLGWTDKIRDAWG